MIEITETGVTAKSCPNCDRTMNLLFSRKTKHYRHSETFKELRWKCDSCRITLDLKYQSRIFQTDYNHGVTIHDYEL